MSDEKPSAGDRLKRWQFPKGVSGNTAGRPKGLEKRTRELLGTDIDAITYVERCVALGMPPDPEVLGVLGVELTPDQRTAIARTFSTIKVRDAIEAAKNLKDRGWGKAKQTVKINEGAGSRMPAGMGELTVDELEIAAKLDAGLEGFTDDDLEGLDANGPGHGETQH